MPTTFKNLVLFLLCHILILVFLFVLLLIFTFILSINFEAGAYNGTYSLAYWQAKFYPLGQPLALK